MKSLEELYKEIIASEEKKEAFAKSVQNEAVEEFLKKNGCNATLKEVQEFFKSKKELSEEELAKVAGAGCVDDVFSWLEYSAFSVVTIGASCAVSAVASGAAAGIAAATGDGDSADDIMEDCSRGLLDPTV